MIYFATAMFHLGAGIQMMVSQESFSAPVFVKLIMAAPIQVWGVAHVMAWALLTVGAYYRFPIGRLGLALGLFLIVAEGLLIEVAPGPAGRNLLFCGLVAALHLSQASEPPINPLTRRG